MEQANKILQNSNGKKPQTKVEKSTCAKARERRAVPCKLVARCAVLCHRGNRAMEEKEGWVEAGAEDKGGGGGGAPDGAALVAAVQSFFYENDDFAEIFERFANENCDVIDLASEEMKLEYTELHQEFVSIFEEQMEGFIESQGSSVIDFYSVLREAADRDPDSNESLLGQIMYATCDFDVFMLMMRETKRRQDWKRAEEAEQEQRQQQNNRK